MALSNGDKIIVGNLRFRWKDKLAHLSDEKLSEEYRDFGQSDMFGNNDERFLEWLDIPSD